MATQTNPGQGNTTAGTPQYTATEQSALSLYNSGMPSAQIATQLGITLPQLQSILSMYGVSYSVSPSPQATPGPTQPGTPGPSGPDPNQALINALLGGTSGGSSTAAADLAERSREFNITTQRDIAKENASEVDSLQKLLIGLTGPKDPYAYSFFSRGLTPPQGYAPAGVPLTDAQVQAWSKQNPGKSPADLQTSLTGGGQAPAWGSQGVLGNMPNSMQQSPVGTALAPMAPSPSAPQQAGPPKTPGYLPTQAAQSGVGQAPPVPSMAAGGTVPGDKGNPTLTVLHGGETVTPADGTAGAPGGSQVHPAIAKLLDAISGLIASPDFAAFTGALQATQQQGETAGPASTQQATPGSPPEVTPGGVQAAATGGTIAASNPLGAPPGVPGANTSQPPSIPGQAGAQGVLASQNAAGQAPNPLLPQSQMDPYSRSLYDRLGRLHPYSAQQETQMGPSGTAAVQDYVGRVEGMDVKDYTNLVDRLRPQGAPQAGDVQSEGFTTG